jgi:hypothetical protein
LLYLCVHCFLLIFTSGDGCLPLSVNMAQGECCAVVASQLAMWQFVCPKNPTVPQEWAFYLVLPAISATELLTGLHQISVGCLVLAFNICVILYVVAYVSCKADSGAGRQGPDGKFYFGLRQVVAYISFVPASCTLYLCYNWCVVCVLLFMLLFACRILPPRWSASLGATRRLSLEPSSVSSV